MERKELAFSTNEADTARQRRAKKIVKKLRELFPDAKIVLKYSNTWELLVAVRLSAQCTDKKVNEVTEKLFEQKRRRHRRRYPRDAAFPKAGTVPAQRPGEDRKEFDGLGSEKRLVFPYLWPY